MKEFFEEFGYMCSSSNTKSRGLYIFIAIAMAVLALGCLASLVLKLVLFIAGSPALMRSPPEPVDHVGLRPGILGKFVVIPGMRRKTVGILMRPA